MRLGTEYRLEIKIRGFSIRVRPLSITESMQVASEVMDDFNRLPPSAKNSLSENTILAKKTLITASTSGPGANDPTITDLVLSQMTNDELHFLFKQYVAACDRVNPALELMSAEDVKLLADEIKKNSGEELDLQLIELSFLELASMAHYFLTKGD